MFKTILALLLLSILAHSFQISQNKLEKQKFTIPWPFDVCGTGKWKMQSLTLSGIPIRNSNCEIDVGTAMDYIQFKKSDLTVKLNGVFLHSQTVDFKNSYDEGDTIQFKYKNYIPQFSPSGTYTLIFNFSNSNNAAEGCFQMTFKI